MADFAQNSTGVSTKIGYNVLAHPVESSTLRAQTACLVGDVIRPFVTVGVTGVVARFTRGFLDLFGFSVWSIVSGFHVEDVTLPAMNSNKVRN